MDETTAPSVDDRTTGDDTPHHDALVLIDLQEDFLGAPGMRARRPSLLRAVRQWIDLAEDAGALVVEVRTELPNDPEAWALNMRDDDQPVVLEGTPGAARVTELSDVRALTVRKRRDDAFFGTGLADVLRRHGVQRLVLAGVATEACVLMTAATAYANDVRVLLAGGGAVTSTDDRAHTEALRWLAEQYRQEVAEPEDGWPHR